MAPPQRGAQRSEYGAVDRLRVHHGWFLLSRAEFIRQTQARLWLDQACDATRAAMFVYAAALYAACSGVEGDARREQGYRELHRWLYDIAYQRYKDVAAEATQRALLLTYTGFGCCRRPGGFLMFALLQLHTAARQLRRPATVQPELDRSRRRFQSIGADDA